MEHSPRRQKLDVQRFARVFQSCHAHSGARRRIMQLVEARRRCWSGWQRATRESVGRKSHRPGGRWSQTAQRQSRELQRRASARDRLPPLEAIRPRHSSLLGTQSVHGRAQDGGHAATMSFDATGGHGRRVNFSPKLPGLEPDMLRDPQRASEPADRAGWAPRCLRTMANTRSMRLAPRRLYAR